MTRTAALLLLLPALLAPTLPPPASAQDRPSTPQARLSTSADNTRLVLETPTRLTYHVNSLAHPSRLVIDIPAAALPPPLINALSFTAQSYVGGLRAARPGPNATRIVFDVTADIAYRIHRLRPDADHNHRLVIDITPKPPPADPLKALIEQLQLEQHPPPAPPSASLPDAPPPPFLVVVDPGHGGADPGAVSPNRTLEKKLVLQISHKLATAINRRPGLQAHLTRTDDRFIPLFERVRIAHRAGADIFVSIHADSVESRRAMGSSVFILSKKGASSKFAREMAQQANLGDLIGGSPTAARDSTIDAALRQFSQDGKDRDSRRLATLILRNMGTVNRLHSRRIESAGFAVLKSPSIPSVLVETAFLSNPKEEKKLLNPNFQTQLAETIADAIADYHQKYHTPL